MPVQDIEDYKKAMILMKSVDLVRYNAEKDRLRRTSPSRYTQIQSKLGNSKSNKTFEFSLQPKGKKGTESMP